MRWTLISGRGGDMSAVSMTGCGEGGGGGEQENV